MKKFLFIACLSLLCVSCKANTEYVRVCTYKGNDSGIDIKQNITLTASEDELIEVIDEIKYTFSDIEKFQDDIDLLTKEYKNKETCAEPLDGDACSKNVVFTWKQTKDAISSKTVVDIKNALKDEESLTLFDSKMKSSEYISYKKTLEALKALDYSCKEQE